MSIKKLAKLALANKTVLLRVDYNVPLTTGQTRRVRDPRRIQASYKTVDYLLRLNCKVVLLSHLGRHTISRKRNIRSRLFFNT